MCVYIYMYMYMYMYEYMCMYVCMYASTLHKNCMWVKAFILKVMFGACLQLVQGTQVESVLRDSF